MNIFSLISQATIVVKFILLVLVLFSVFSWAIIIYKARSLKQAEVSSRQFLETFRRSKSLNEVNEAARRYKNSPLSAIFQAGFKELVHLTRSNPQPQNPINGGKLELINRSLLRASNEEINRLEKMMTFLATCGSVTPFIGLFGTVWGIMDAFHKIGVVRSASLVTVAPGIAEALIATAIGLFAAIPAVIAYNHFLGRIKEIITTMDDFNLEFLNIVEKAYGS
ncbi:MAG TPA: protein TolQ [Candidatus Saccharicenans sp.]|jgi:biopolymer transport protein TolQ|nr:protein TolQ [Candidatus Saccharicenans sp.]HPC88621.1 protein TolQ [Candidatus Saccharicenans sp.]HQE65061.1 protein TolQ [Candidatus Saccharicenans sp.]HRV06711.1 protein TolQ [Candidatus Saccharicenans sp.]